MEAGERIAAFRQQHPTAAAPQPGPAPGALTLSPKAPPHVAAHSKPSAAPHHQQPLDTTPGRAVDGRPQRPTSSAHKESEGQEEQQQQEEDDIPEEASASLFTGEGAAPTLAGALAHRPGDEAEVQVLELAPEGSHVSSSSSAASQAPAAAPRGPPMTPQEAALLAFKEEQRKLHKASAW